MWVELASSSSCGLNSAVLRSASFKLAFADEGKVLGGSAKACDLLPLWVTKYIDTGSRLALIYTQRQTHKQQTSPEKVLPKWKKTNFCPTIALTTHWQTLGDTEVG